MSRERAAMFRENRRRAESRGDWNMVRAMDVELSRLGRPLETTQAAVMDVEMAVPEKRRGRPPRPRCEHNLFPDRCPDCTENLLA